VKAVAITLGLLFTLVGCFATFAIWSTESHPISKRKMAKLHTGMPASEVAKILGSPKEIQRLTTGGFSWIYGHQLQWYYFSVEFSTSSNVVQFYEDD
jgi:hypothetical protein